MPGGFVGVATVTLLPPLLALVGYVSSILVTGIPVLSLAIGAGLGLIPVAILSAKRRGRMSTLRDAWPIAIDVIVSAIRSGDSLPQAVASLAERGPEPLRPALREFRSDYLATGEFASALERMKSRLGDSTVDRVVSAILLAQQVGGRELVRVLQTLASFTRDEQESRKEISARQSWTVSGARAAVAAPWLILLLFSTKPAALAAFRTSAGNALIAIGTITTFAGYRLMLFLGRVSPEGRSQ